VAKQKILAAAPQAKPKRQTREGFQLGWLLFPSLTGAVAVFLVLFITLASLGVWLSGPANADVAMIQDVDGLVELAEKQDSSEWVALSGGEAVRSGQQIRTAPGSSVTVVYSDGSRTRISADTTILFREVDGTWGGDLQVEIEQWVGKTSHKVIPLRSQSAFFKVRTPAGIASVHGTSFTVDVKNNGVARVIVDSGEVAVTSSTEEILLPAGQATLLQAGAPPKEAGNFFSIVDFVVAIDGLDWAVSGQRFQIDDLTYISGAPAIGQALQIEGRILPSGEWIADSIAPVDNTARSTFTGIIEAITQGRWLIGGKNIAISEITQLEAELIVGDQVEVTYLTLSNEDWLAVNVNKLEETAAETSESTTSGVLTQTAESALPVCDLTHPSPEALTLAESFSTSPDEIMQLACLGLSFEEIELAYNLSVITGWPVFEIANLRLSGLAWEEINAVLLENESPSTTTGTTACIGIAFEPKAQQLAQKYDVPYQEIINLLCQGYSFGSIDLAYKLAAEEGNLGYTPAEILKMREEGMSWGQIKKASKEQKPERNNQENVPPGQENRPTKEPKPTKETRPENDESPSSQPPGQNK
jgi:hypothetical protein